MELVPREVELVPRKVELVPREVELVPLEDGGWWALGPPRPFLTPDWPRTGVRPPALQPQGPGCRL